MSPLEEAATLLGHRVERDRPLGPLTTYRVGGPAALFLEARARDDLEAARKAVMATGIPVLVLGKGSNLLVADAGFPGLVVSLGSGFDSIEVTGTDVRAGAGAGLPVLARRTAAASLTGLEWAVGVPGSVGGGVRMNAGGHGSDIAGCLDRFEYLDLLGGPDGERGLRDLEYGYRRSSVASAHVVLWASFRLTAGERRRSEAQIAEIVRWRRANQPGGQNAGSVFTNPENDSAGRVIEACGLKGLRSGTARVSEKHANFIQADPGGSADDVRRLIDMVRVEVRERAGFDLVTEVRMVGFG